MDLPNSESDRRWEQRLVRRIKSTVYKERAMGIAIEKICRRHLARSRNHQDAIARLAELAGVDWLYNPETGEVRFFD